MNNKGKGTYNPEYYKKNADRLKANMKKYREKKARGEVKIIPAPQKKSWYQFW